MAQTKAGFDLLSGAADDVERVNRALHLNSVWHVGVIATFNEPGAGPHEDGDAYFVGAAPAGDWSAFTANAIVYHVAGKWYAVTPRAGMELYDASAPGKVSFNGTAWA